MLAQVNIGGIVVTFGEPQAVNKPEPFYPYLTSFDAIQDSTGEETGSTSFSLSLKAKDLIALNVRRHVLLLSDTLEPLFEGVIGGITYAKDVRVRVEA